MFRICSLLWLLCAALPATAQQFSGQVQVVDGDTFDIGQVRVRLHGIDAVEADQTCIDRAGTRWACGAWVIETVRAQYQGARATCLGIETDRYGRTVAKCVIGGADLGAALVRDGLAQAYRQYSMDYDLLEKEAYLRGAGLWSSSTMVPADQRRTTQTADTAPPNADCVIKGNISNSGQIYHVPGQENYADTVINTRRGERWFCSQSEAQAAGWRAARR